MVTEAQKFLNGEGDWAGLAVDQSAMTKEPFSGLLSVDLSGGEPLQEETLVQNLGARESKLAEYLTSQEYLQAIDRIWNSYFVHLILEAYTGQDLKDFVHMLHADFALSLAFGQTKAPDHQAGEKKRTFIVLPNKLFPIIDLRKNTNSQMGDDVVLPLAVGNLQMVRRRMQGYRPGDLAKVVNLFRGERKEIVHRKLDRVEEQTRDQNSRDHVNEERGK